MEKAEKISARLNGMRNRDAERRVKVRLMQEIRNKMHDEIDDLEIEILDARWREKSLEREISEVTMRKAELHRERVFNEVSLAEYKKGLVEHKELEAGLRHEAENKRKEAERVRTSASLACLSGLDHRMHGNMSKAIPILRKVEGMIQEAEDIDKKADAHVRTLDQYESWTRVLDQHMRDIERRSVQNAQEIEECGSELQELKKRLLDMVKTSADHRIKILNLREEEHQHGYVIDILENKAGLAEMAADVLKKDAEDVAKSMALLDLDNLPATDEPEPQADDGE